MKMSIVLCLITVAIGSVVCFMSICFIDFLEGKTKFRFNVSDG